MFTPFLLLLVIILCPSNHAEGPSNHAEGPSNHAEGPSNHAEGPPNTYYYKNKRPHTSASSSNHPTRKYYYKPAKSSRPTTPEPPPHSFLQKLMYKKVSTFANWMDKKSSKYFNLVPHSGKYPGKENPLTGDPYPWSTETSKYNPSSDGRKTKPNSKSYTKPKSHKSKSYTKPKSHKSKSLLQSMKSYIHNVLPLPKGLSTFWKSQLASSDDKVQDTAMKENMPPLSRPETSDTMTTTATGVSTTTAAPATSTTTSPPTMTSAPSTPTAAPTTTLASIPAAPPTTTSAPPTTTATRPGKDGRSSNEDFNLGNGKPDAVAMDELINDVFSDVHNSEEEEEPNLSRGAFMVDNEQIEDAFEPSTVAPEDMFTPSSVVENTTAAPATSTTASPTTTSASPSTTATRPGKNDHSSNEDFNLGNEKPDAAAMNEFINDVFSDVHDSEEEEAPTFSRGAFMVDNEQIEDAFEPIIEKVTKMVSTSKDDEVAAQKAPTSNSLTENGELNLDRENINSQLELSSLSLNDTIELAAEFDIPDEVALEPIGETVTEMSSQSQVENDSTTENFNQVDSNTTEKEKQEDTDGGVDYNREPVEANMALGMDTIAIFKEAMEQMATPFVYKRITTTREEIKTPIKRITTSRIVTPLESYHPGLQSSKPAIHNLHPYFRKHEVVATKFVVPEMVKYGNGEFSHIQDNSHLHFPEFSIHHPKFHEFHDKAPKFFDPALKIHSLSHKFSNQVPNIHDPAPNILYPGPKFPDPAPSFHSLAPQFHDPAPKFHDADSSIHSLAHKFHDPAPKLHKLDPKFHGTDSNFKGKASTIGSASDPHSANSHGTGFFQALHHIADTMDGILPLPKGLSDFWNSQTSTTKAPTTPSSNLLTLKSQVPDTMFDDPASSSSEQQSLVDDGYKLVEANPDYSSTSTTFKLNNLATKSHQVQSIGFFSKFQNGGNFAVQKSKTSPSLSSSNLPTVKLSATSSSSKYSRPIDTGSLTYLVSDPANPGSDFLLTRTALIQSGLIYNKVVSMSSFTLTNAGGQVEILDSKSFHLTSIQYGGSGPARWIAGTTFPIGFHSDTVVLASWTPGLEEEHLTLPGQVTVADFHWLALYCRTCVEGRVVMQVYVPETFL